METKFNPKLFLSKKRIIWGIVLIVLMGGIAYATLGGDEGPEVITTTVERQNLERTVLATGQVVSSVDLSLSLQASGVVRQILVTEGQVVSAGQLLATLDREQARASLTIAQGALAQAQANYEKVLAGASGEDVQVSQSAVAAAETTLENAYSTLLNSGLEAQARAGNYSTGNLSVSGAYTGTKQGQYLISIESPEVRIYGREVEESAGAQFERIQRVVPIAIGTKGLYLNFSASGDFITGDRWTIDIPNTRASTYLTNLNAYEAAKKSLAQAKAALDLKKSDARPQDVKVAEAQVLSAQGQVASALATYNNAALRAPSGGTITQIDIKAGEQANALQQVMILQDVGNLHVEANISEADIAALAVGQTVDYTFDALGPDLHFQGEIESVNPASTVISGIVNYKVTANVQEAEDIKPGMTANMTVLSATREGVLALPSSAVINRGGRKYVRVLKDADEKEYEEVEIQTGLNADGGLIEIISGLEEGMEVVIDIRL